MPVLGCARPIVQAPIGGCAGPELVAAVAEAGGLGVLPCTWTDAPAIADAVAAIRTLTARPFAANLVLVFPVEERLAALLDLGVDVITFSWGQPGRALVERCHAAGAAVAVQIGTPGAAATARDDGADVLIAQGLEAGGHVQSTTPLGVLLPAVVRAARGAPVIATGGLATASDVRGVIERGASAAMLGTRFVASRESEAHAAYKDALVDAGDDATSYTLCFDGGWPFAAHRVLRNPTLERWEAAGCPPPGSRPGEGDTVALRADGSALARYADAPPHRGDRGAILDACLYAGAAVAAITDVPGAAELVRRLDAT